MRLEGNEGASHMDIQKKSGPGGGNVSAKVLRHARRVRGTARSQGAGVQWATRTSGRCLRDTGWGGPEAVLRARGQMGSQERVPYREAM